MEVGDIFMDSDKKVLVTKSSLPDYEGYCRKIKSVWSNSWLTNCGPIHEELEKKLSKYLNVRSISLYTNGHLALENALNILDLKGEIITTPFSFVSTTSAIVKTGNIPVFCDINAKDYTIDVDKIEKLITKKTVAILPVHVYGNVCDVVKIAKIAKKYNLKVIYDAAHAFGVKYKNKSIATYGDITMFSFHATKVFNTIEGGGLVFSDQALKLKAEALKNFGITNYEETEYVGGNAKMSEFQAAMGICNLECLDDNIARRKRIVDLYRRLLANIPGISINDIQLDVTSNYSYFPIKVEDEYMMTRDQLFELLCGYNIYPRKYFYPAINNLGPYKKYRGRTSIATDISNRILVLPLYPDLELSVVERICKIIKEGR